MINIILNEWKMFTRNRVFVYSTIFFVLSLSLVVWMGINQNKGQTECVKLFVNSIINQSPSPIPFDEIVENSILAINISNKINTNN